MSTEKLGEGVPSQPEPALPQPSLENVKKVGGGESKVSGALFSSPSRIAVEHNYAKLVPFRNHHSTGNKDSSFSTVVLFADRVSSKLKKKGVKGKKRFKHVKAARMTGLEDLHNSHGEASTEEGDSSALQVPVEVESSGEDIIDVTSVDPVVSLAYDEKKVSSIMVECARHVSLVKVPTDPLESEAVISRTLSECDHRQRTLLKQLMAILEGDKLARLACVSVPHEPIKRRLNTDKAARRFRKVLASVKWDPKLTRWCHETLLHVLDTALLPIYLDILQVLKAKCPVLVEHMIHSSMHVAGGEAFSLLLKRPWNPAVGLYTTEKQVKFEPSPIFVTLPYSTTGLGGRRWRMWQTQLGVMGKVFPIILPDNLTDVSLNVTLPELAGHMLGCSLQRVRELSLQFPTRPVVLIGFSLASRIAAKIAEVLSVSLIISLGLPASGVEHKWKISSDPFKDCRVPTLFAVGSEGKMSSVAYTEKVRGKMKPATSLIVVGGGDDLLRLSLEDKQLEVLTQSIVDRCILDEIYKFMVHILPCSFHSADEQHKLLPRKRKIVHSEEIGSMFLTPVLAQSPVVLTPTADDVLDGKNLNFNNSSPFWRALLKQSGRVSPGGSLSSSPSPISLLERRFTGELGIPSAKRIAAELLPKTGRPRSKSTADKPKKKTSARSRSRSQDQATKNTAVENNSLNTFSPITFNQGLNSNNSNNVSPPSTGILSVPIAHFRPLPITPPRNPYEDQPVMDRQLDPKTLRHLQLK